MEVYLLEDTTLMQSLYSLRHGIFFFPLPFTDPSLTHSNVTCALTSVSTERLTVCLMIPYSVEVKITDVYKDVRRQRQQFIHYYVNYSPYSTTWIFLSGRLHRWEETTAETYVKKFVRGTPGMGVACIAMC